MKKILEKLRKDKSFAVSIIALFVFIFAIVIAIFILNGTKDKNALKLDANGNVEYNVKSPYSVPEIGGIDSWINSTPLKISDLKGKVVVIDFWTYSCINCIRTLPYVTNWYDKYKDNGLVVIGMHSPEFSFEKQHDNVQKAVTDYKINYPVALDNDLTTWRNFNNQYWPATYFIDRDGKVRHTHFGEGQYVEDEKVIRQLLQENGTKLSTSAGTDSGNLAVRQDQSPETYLNYSRGSNFANSTEFIADQNIAYVEKNNLLANQWTLGGNWTIGTENSISESNDSTLKYNFSAKEVYLVMGSDTPTTVSVKVNGKIVSDVKIAGSDVGMNGIVSVKDSKLYRLVVSPDFINGELELQFSKGVKVNAFTFGE